MNFLKSSNLMLWFWIGCAVLGLVYLFWVWPKTGSPAFIVSQIFMGLMGALRELYLQRKALGLCTADLKTIKEESR